MVMIQVDEQTAKMLENAASDAGLSLAEYVRTLVQADFKQTVSAGWDELEKEFEDLSVDCSLPIDFSRADIYSDHD